MKKAIFILGFLILATISFISVRAQRDEEEASDCPNGCLVAEGYCWCNGFHAHKEKQW